MNTISRSCKLLISSSYYHSHGYCCYYHYSFFIRINLNFPVCSGKYFEYMKNGFQEMPREAKSTNKMYRV